MTANELVEKVERQGSNIDEVDCYRILDAYTELFGIYYSPYVYKDQQKMVLYEVKYMYEKLKEYVKEGRTL